MYFSLMKSNNYSDHLNYILSEMCKRVGADPETIDFNSPDWFMHQEWTPEEQDGFIRWLANELKTNPILRKGFGHLPRSVRYLTRLAQSFVYNHGWKTKDKENGG